jgi:hypothetical protein
MTVEEVVNAINLQNPTGISSKWQISENEKFRSGEPNPCVCERDPDRRHYLMVC